MRAAEKSRTYGQFIYAGLPVVVIETLAKDAQESTFQAMPFGHDNPVVRLTRAVAELACRGQDMGAQYLVVREIWAL